MSLLESFVEKTFNGKYKTFHNTDISLGIKRKGFFKKTLLDIIPLNAILCVTIRDPEGEEIYQVLKEKYGEKITDEW